VHSGASNLEWYAQHSGSQRWVDAANCELLLLSRSAERDNLILCVDWFRNYFLCSAISTIAWTGTVRDGSSVLRAGLSSVCDV
jgi:hypothetical protein